MSKKIEDLEVYQNARKIVQHIYLVCNSKLLSRDYFLKDQMRRSSISIMSNISEGYQRSSDADFARFLYIAKGSCGELKAQLLVGLDQRYYSVDEYTILNESCDKMLRQLTAFIKYLKK